jgi:hypothetical protein
MGLAGGSETGDSSGTTLIGGRFSKALVRARCFPWGRGGGRVDGGIAGGGNGIALVGGRLNGAGWIGRVPLCLPSL